MKVVIHQTPCIGIPQLAFHNILIDLEEPSPVVIVQKDILLVVPAGHNVVKGSWIFEPKRSGHNKTIIAYKCCNSRSDPKATDLH
ncbi:MAG TPA: hypothetical protein PK146_03010, partial [Synergistales bacterium]|nr:hypothetical protein [Synergistales bacterium]